MSKLKPCPFCGGKPFISAKLPYFGEEPTVAVVCEDCNASSKHKRDEEKAIEAWNRRVKDAVPVAPGRWMERNYDNAEMVVECSNCHDVFFMKIEFCFRRAHYCPNCGAKMDGERREDND